MKNNSAPDGFAAQAIMFPHHGVLDTHRLPPGGTGLGLGLALQDKTNSYAPPLASPAPPLVFHNNGISTLSRNLLERLAVVCSSIV